MTYSIFKGGDRLEGQDERRSSWSQSGGRWWTPKARQWAAGQRDKSDRLESLQGQGTNEAGDWVHKGVKQQIITVQCSKKSHLLWGLKNKEESARWRGGEDHWSQKCGSGYWTCLPWAFPAKLQTYSPNLSEHFQREQKPLLPLEPLSTLSQNEFIHLDRSNPPGDAAQGCFAELVILCWAPHLLLNGELLGILHQPSTAQFLFLGNSNTFDPNDLQ